MKFLNYKSSSSKSSLLTWPSILRLIHWLIALSLLGGISMFDHGEYGHSELSWIALGLLFFTQISFSQTSLYSPVIWFVTAVLAAINLSGLIAPDDTIHISVTLIGVLIGAFYFATVVFESINWMSGDKSKDKCDKTLLI
jgi:cytochrome b